MSWSPTLGTSSRQQAAGQSAQSIRAGSVGSAAGKGASSSDDECGVRQETMQASCFGAIIATLLDAVNPLSQQRSFQELQCAVLQFDIADGMATSRRGLALRTAALSVLGSGALNLRTEQIRRRFKTARSMPGTALITPPRSKSWSSIDNGSARKPERSSDRCSRL
jgi:hypothetical protein